MRAVCAVATVFAAGAQGTPSGSAAPVYAMMGSDSPAAGFRGTAAPNAAVAGGVTPGMGASNSPPAGFHGTAAPNAAVGMYATGAPNAMTPGMGASNSPPAGFHGTAAPNAAVGMYATGAPNAVTPGMGASNSPSAGMRPATVVPTTYPTLGMAASNSPSAGFRGTAAPNAVTPGMGATNSPSAGVRGTVAPNVAMGATNSPTAGVRATSNPSVASPQGSRAPTGCQNEQTFHAKDCPQCNCAWFEQDPAQRCTKFGKAQGAVRSADGKWHNANKACCVCKNYHAAPATGSPTAAPVPQVTAGGGVGGCNDYRGDNQKGDRNAAFSIKGCPDCTCEWMSRAGRCGMYGKYSGAIRDSANKKWLKASEACCVCAGGAH